MSQFYIDYLVEHLLQNAERDAARDVGGNRAVLTLQESKHTKKVSHLAKCDS